jgi:hypothetical protein
VCKNLTLTAIHQTKTWWTGIVGNAALPDIMQNGQSEA